MSKTRSFLRDAGVVAAGSAAVFIGGWVPSIWTDEAATISAATRSWSELWIMLHQLDGVHGLYYAVMHLWIAVAGTSEAALRLPSALAVGIAALGMTRLAQNLGRPDLALTAGIVFVFLPRVSWSGIEARPFALATAAGVWATVVLLKAIRDGGKLLWVGYVVIASVAVLLNLYLVLLVIAHGVALLGVDRGRFLLWFANAVGIAVITSPFLIVVARQRGQLGVIDPAPVFLARNIVVNQWFLGETPAVYIPGEPAKGLDPGEIWQMAAVALALLAAAVIGLAVYRGRQTPLVWWAGAIVVVPTAALVTWAVISHTYSPRYTTFTSPGIALLVAAGISLLKRVDIQRWAAGALVLLAVPVFVSQRAPEAKSGSDWRWVAHIVAAQTRPGDAVYFSPRRPSEENFVGLTTRGVATAYPSAFGSLHDLTLQTTPAQAGNLTGWSVPLNAVADLAEVETVVVIRRINYTEAAVDDDTFAQAGLRVEDRWTGSIDEVVLFRR